MLNVIICGILGNMGEKLSRACFDAEDISVAAGVALESGTLAGIPIFDNISACDVESDVVIDFSSPALTDDIVEFCSRRNLALVMCTTGHSEAQLEKIKALSQTVPVFKSANMSLGVALLADLARRAAAALGDDFDIEIVERHHRRKVDAPSGTAVMLADTINASRGNRYDYVYERQSVRQPRQKRELGIHSLRGGTIVGEHEIVFAGNDEVIALSHSALSRAVFASGAIAAARFIVRQKPGLYDMQSLVAAM